MLILFIDDDLDDFEIFEEAFRQVHPGGNVIHQTDCAAALTFLNASSGSLPDYIFLDLNMPQMNGIERLRELKADPRLKQIPVILFSTTVAPYDREKYQKLGAVDSIAKPSQFNEVVGVIRRLQVQR